MELADFVGLAGTVLGAFNGDGKAPKKYKVGSAEFEENHVIGPAGPIPYNIRTTANEDGIRYVAIIRIDTDLEDTTYQAYEFLADRLKKWHVLRGTKDEFATIARKGLLANGRKEDFTGGNGTLHASVQNDAEDAINLQFIDKLKKGNAWQKYFSYAAEYGKNAEAMMGATGGLAVLFGLVAGVGAGFTAGLELGASILTGIGGIVFGVVEAAAVLYVSEEIREARFYRKCQDGSRIKRYLKHIDETLVKFESVKNNLPSIIKEQGEKVERLHERLGDLEKEERPIREYAEQHEKLSRDIITTADELEALKVSEKNLKETVTGLYWLAGELADKESRKRGLVLTYTADTPEKVREFIKRLAEKPEVKQPEKIKVAGRDPIYIGDTFVLNEADAQVKPAENPKIDDYELLEQIGEGGIGKVYKAKKGEEIVTIKVPHQDAKKFFERDKETLDAIMALEHPNIARVKKVQTEGQAFEIREYVEGKSLDKTIKDARTVDESLNILRQMASGLAYAHEKGVIHGDMKPQNVLVGEQVKIADFDLSRVHDPNEIALSLTRTGVVGTFDYMAPEQRDGKLATMQTDVYSFGAVAFELLTGVSKNATRKPMNTLNPKIPADAIEIVEKCLETSPAERYQNMQEVVQVLNRPQKEKPKEQTIPLKENKSLQKIIDNQSKEALEKIIEHSKEELME